MREDGNIRYDGEENVAEREFTVELQLVEDYQFRVRFEPSDTELLMDEPEPEGGGAGPNATRLLAAAVGNCLSASLLFCLRKSRLEPEGLRATVTLQPVRNDDGRLRVRSLDVELRLDAPGASPERLRRCLEIFEDYCVVTQSVREGIDVDVAVRDPSGESLRSATAR